VSRSCNHRLATGENIKKKTQNIKMASWICELPSNHPSSVLAKPTIEKTHATRAMTAAVAK
jgi:hypothetical protein